jgi:hypothetical protein
MKLWDAEFPDGTPFTLEDIDDFVEDIRFDFTPKQNRDYKAWRLRLAAALKEDYKNGITEHTSQRNMGTELYHILFPDEEGYKTASKRVKKGKGRLIGAAKNVVIPKGEFKAEHAHLLKLLKNPTKEALDAEYKKQKGEVEKVLQGGALQEESTGGSKYSDLAKDVMKKMERESRENILDRMAAEINQKIAESKKYKGLERAFADAFIEEQMEQYNALLALHEELSRKGKGIDEADEEWIRHFAKEIIPIATTAEYIIDLYDSEKVRPIADILLVEFAATTEDNRAYFNKAFTKIYHMDFEKKMEEFRNLEKYAYSVANPEAKRNFKEFIEDITHFHDYYMSKLDKFEKEFQFDPKDDTEDENPKGSAMPEQLDLLGMSGEAYLKEAKKKAKKAGYDPKKLTLCKDGKHKLDYDGVKFGAVGYGDFILYKFLEKKGEVPKGTAAKKRRVFRKSHGAMKDSGKGSANQLALAVLWA